MKKVATSMFMAAGAILVTSVQAQVEVSSEGTIKVGDLSKPRNVSGNSLDIAVERLYIYPTANKSGSFVIYNHTASGPVTGGGTVTAHSAVDPYKDVITNPYNLPTYVEPVTAGYLMLGTSTKPLGNIHAGSIYSSGQKITSDRRAKRNIRSLESSTEYLRALRSVRFDFATEIMPLSQDQAKDKIGFIAQEVGEILPELVSYDTLSDLYSMDYVSLIPVLTKGFQEQDSIVRSQQAMLEAQGEMLILLSEQLEAIRKMISGTSAPKKSPVKEHQTGTNLLYQNTPNPFKQETRIRYELASEAQKARLEVYDLHGVQLLGYDLPVKGKGEWVLRGGSLQAGIYLYCLVVDGVQVDMKRMVLVN